MELAPFFCITERGCQGFIGPLPSAFLDKRPIWGLKELAQK